MTIHYLPLERIETRYTAHLDDAILAHLGGRNFIRYYPEMGGRAELPPPPGHFLNAPSTIEFKARQLAALAENWADGLVADGDMIFASDLWFPGLEAVGYLRHFTGVEANLRGILWAGAFTDYDLVRGFERWAAPFETAILDLADQVFVGSEHLRQDILRKRLAAPERVIVTGAPLDPALPRRAPTGGRAPLVIFNGRLSPEKQPQLLDNLRDDYIMDTGYRRAEFVNAIELGLSKQGYYNLLNRATCVVSFALEETFGFGVQEAVALGCVPVLPNRCCYPEQFPPEYLYDSWDECVEKVGAAIAGLLPPPVPVRYEAVPRWFAP